MPSEPVFETSVDPQRNLVRSRFAGRLSAAAMAAAARRVEVLLPQLQPGFALLADFGRVEAMELEGASHLTRIMELCRAHQVGLIVRILPKRPSGDIGINILAAIHYRGKVRTVTVDTAEEAERALR